jgi:type IV secretion system protein VirB9
MTQFEVLFVLAALSIPSAIAPAKSANHAPVKRVATANVEALLEPSSAGFVQAVQTYPYSEGTLYRVYAAPGQLTDIILQPGETVSSVAAGDTVRWTVGDTTSGSSAGKRTHILIKPFVQGLKTNLVIATDRRTYHLALESTSRTAMAAISWTYPADELLALKHEQAVAEAAMPVAAGITVDRLNFNYAIQGDKVPWRPVRAFDDGRQTYIEFPIAIAVGEAPPLFVTGSSGVVELVNYRMSGRYYIVDRLFGAAELRLGEKHQQVVRIRRVYSIDQRTGR